MSHVSGHTDGSPNWVWDAAHGGGGTATKKAGGSTSSRVVKSWEKLNELIPNWEQRSLPEILAAAPFSGKNGLTIAPDFWQAIQQYYLSGEKDSGFSVSDITANLPAGISTRSSTLKSALKAAGSPGGGGSGGGGGGGGSGGGPQIYGASAPDPATAISGLIRKYEAEIAAGNLSLDQAKANFSVEAEQASAQHRQEQLLFDQQEAQERANREREIARSSRGISIQQERGSRATSLARDILPYSFSGNVPNISVPYLGQVPTTQINPDQFYDLEGLNAIPDIGATSSVPFTPPSAVNPFTQIPQISMPTMPDISPYINQAARGFSGWSG